MRYLMPSILALFLGFGCAGSPLPDVAELPEVVNAAADKLEQALDFAEQAAGPSKLSALMICDTYGNDSPICVRVTNQIADAEEKISVAKDLVAAYRRAESSFEEANQAVNSALSELEALGQKVHNVTSPK
jgi:hypothetical protein